MKELLLISGLGTLALFAEIFNFKRLLHPLILLGLVMLLGICVSDWNAPATLLFGMMEINHFSLGFTLILTLVALLWFLVSEDYFKEETSLTDHYALILFALTGGFVLVSYTNMVMLFLGIEILSIPLYVLAGSQKDDLLSNEAAFKYFLMGAFASSFLLFGIALIYGVTGSFDLKEIQNVILHSSLSTHPFLLVGLVLMLVGMGFKVSLVPFHFWAPDVYQGAPTFITSAAPELLGVSTVNRGRILKRLDLWVAGVSLGSVTRSLIFVRKVLSRSGTVHS